MAWRASILRVGRVHCACGDFDFGASVAALAASFGRSVLPLFVARISWSWKAFYLVLRHVGLAAALLKAFVSLSCHSSLSLSIM